MEEQIQVLLESGERANVAVIDGKPCVFKSPTIAFLKPRWIDDASAVTCLHCSNKFTQLRRKHHCRSCGRIFCSKCCSEKAILPHIGLHDQCRICLICEPVVSLINKALSAEVKYKWDAVNGFHSFIQKREHMQEILELGGLQILVWLCSCDGAQLLENLVSALHILATQSALHECLLQAGIVRAFSSILQRTSPQDKLATDCISTLLILSNQQASISKVISDGGLSCLLSILSRVDDLTQLLTLQTVMRMSSSRLSYEIVMSDSQVVQYLISIAANTTDVQKTTLVFRIFCEISTGVNFPSHKATLAQAEVSTSYISRNLKQKNSDLLTYLTCLIANIASDGHSQAMLGSLIPQIGSLLSNPSQKYTLHVIRALANLSQYSQHSTSLVSQISSVLSLMEAGDSERSQCLRFLFNLMHHCPDIACGKIAEGDATLLLRNISKISPLMTAMIDAVRLLTKDIDEP